jgi:hypothetical protein
MSTNDTDHPTIPDEPIAGGHPTASEEPSDFFRGRRLPPNSTPMRLLGVDYVHVPTSNGGDLYLTRYGLPFVDHLQWENWRDDRWFKENRERLNGTSVVYRIPTKVVNDRAIELVVKYCRVGEDVPLDTRAFEEFTQAEFNSPYEEFALVMELRARRAGVRIRTHHPLAIYVPPERLELWQTGRKVHRIERKKAKCRDVELDILRGYVLIYQWIKGESADVALELTLGDPVRRAEEMMRLTLKAKAELQRNGFQVVDHKPAHVILRCRQDGSLLRDRTGDYAYALIDFELLQRTAEYEQKIQTSRRASYLRHQRDRFEVRANLKCPAHLKPVRILGVDYICGHADSTHGMLWVVGRDPELFDYFLPERWRRTPGKRLSDTNQTYYTLTKDQINLVWKLSRVGEQPELRASNSRAARVAAWGYNSPFEEAAIALELKSKGIDTIYPRAIYMSGLNSTRADLYVSDSRRYQSHREWVTPEGAALLRPDHNYLTIWGFWNGLDEILASKDEAYCRGVNLEEASQNGIVTAPEARRLLRHQQQMLRAAGYEDLLPKPTHYLLSIRHGGSLVLDEDGTPAIRICNFELIRKRPA